MDPLLHIEVWKRHTRSLMGRKDTSEGRDGMPHAAIFLTKPAYFMLLMTIISKV